MSMSISLYVQPHALLFAGAECRQSLVMSNRNGFLGHDRIDSPLVSQNVTTWTSIVEVIPFQSARLSIQLDTRLPSSGIIWFSRIPIGKDWPRIEPARLVFRIPVQTNKHMVWRMSANSLIFSSKIYHNEMGSLYFSGRFWCIPGGWLGRELVARVMKTYPVLWTY